MTHSNIGSGKTSARDSCLDCCPENTHDTPNTAISRRRVVRSGFLAGAVALVASSRTPRSASADHFGCRYPEGTGAPYYLDFSKLYNSRLTDGSILDPITIIQRAYCGYKNGIFPGGKIDLGPPYRDPRSGKLHLWDGYWNQNFSGPLGYTNLMIQPLNGHAYRLYGDWLAKFMERGGPRVFGAPIDDPHAAGPGVEQYLQGGTVGMAGLFRERDGAPVYVVQGAILERYRQETGTSGRLGAPKSNEYAWGSGARSDFANGSIVYHSGGRIEVLVGASPPSATNRQPVIVYLPGPTTNIGGATTVFKRLIQKGFKDYRIYYPTVLYSYNGGKIADNGTWEPADYSCDATFQPLDKSVAHLQALLRKYSTAHPRTDFILVGHSLGGIVAWHTAMRGVLGLHDQGSRIGAVITWGSPVDNLGPDLPLLAAQWPILSGQEGCKGRGYGAALEQNLRSLLTEEDNNRNAERLIANGMIVMSYASTRDPLLEGGAWLVGDVGPVSGFNYGWIESNSAGLICDFGGHSDYNDPAIAWLLWDHMTSYIKYTFENAPFRLPQCR